jgi:predicted Rossmann fold nucleotide-binding protein DprA/Smf involved in DNA uptake
MEIFYLNQDNSDYPFSLLQCSNLNIPASIAILGNLEILKNRMLALFCSVKCPGRLILRAYDLIQELRQMDVTIISGFHSPMEREALNILLRGSNPIVICLARSIEKMRIRSEYKKLLNDGRLLVVSPFIDKPRRPTAETSFYRNQFVVALANQILVTYAESSSKTERTCVFALECKKSLYTLDDASNSNLVKLGARPVSSVHEIFV